MSPEGRPQTDVSGTRVSCTPRQEDVAAVDRPAPTEVRVIASAGSCHQHPLPIASASRSGLQARDVIEWRPGRSSAVTWTALGAGLTVLGLGLFAIPSILRAGPASGTFQIGLVDILLVVALTVLLVVAHEGIHGLAMLAFGARPRFGAIMVSGAVPAVYATSEGHHFTRGQFVVVAVAPAVAVSSLGFVICLGPSAGYMIVPLAVHLGGCVGDAFAGWRALREPRGTECEDLRDGIRFHRSLGDPGRFVPGPRAGEGPRSPVGLERKQELTETRPAAAIRKNQNKCSRTPDRCWARVSNLRDPDQGRDEWLAAARRLA